MNLDEIREHHEAAPFVPFTLRLSSGRAIVVEHPEFMLLPPAGGMFVVWDRSKHLHVLSLESVEQLDFSPVKKGNGRKRRR